MEPISYNLFYNIIFTWFMAGFAAVSIALFYGLIKDGKRKDRHDQ